MAFGDFLSGYYDVGAQLPDYLKNKALEYFKRDTLVKENIQSKEAFEKRKAFLKKYFIEALGGLEIKRTPLNPVCTGEIKREAYTIRKIVFQSQPGIYVTSCLYIPKAIQGKAPAVIFACGHSKSAKAYINYQKVCIDLASNGFVVLAVDPVGQGERMQYYDKESGRTLVPWGTHEHSYAGLQCQLTGSNIARYFIWDLIRAVDYLCALPEVDDTRIGITGNSGGGTQTTYMLLADHRIQAAVDATFITSREAYMKTGQSVDSEQLIYGAISQGLDFDDFLACFAPKPVMIAAVASDFFCIEGTEQSYKRAKKIYELYGCANNIDLCVAEGTHSYNDDLREAAVNWFIRHLKGQEGSFKTDRNMAVEDEKDLLCTSCGQVMGEYEDARTVYDLNVEYFKQHSYPSLQTPSELKDRILKVLNMPRSRDRIYPRTIASYTSKGIKHSDIFFFSEKDIVVDGILLEDIKGHKKGCTILILDEGTHSMGRESDLISRLMEEGNVFVFDPRGMGAAKSRPVNTAGMNRIYGTEFKLNSDAFMMETSLGAMRVYDILRACDYIAGIWPDKEIALAGKGIGAIYALLAAAIRDEVNRVYLEDMIPSFEYIVCSKYYSYDPRLAIHGVLKEFDLPVIMEVFKHKNIVKFVSPDIGKA